LISQLVVETGVAPSELLDAEPGLVQSLVSAVHERDENATWSVERELLAQLIELTSIVRVEALALGGVPKHKLPLVIRVPRPDDDPAGDVPVITPRQFALMTG
jgi:hypothetical protein